MDIGNAIIMCTIGVASLAIAASELYHRPTKSRFLVGFTIIAVIPIALKIILEN